MKQALALLLGLSIACSASAQGPGTAVSRVAIISLIGDVMTIDTYRRRVGTGIDSNHQSVVPLTTPVFDHTALLAAQDAIAKLIPAASIAPLQVPAPGSDSDPARLLADGKVSPSSTFIAALRRDGFTHLLAIAKRRAPARLQMDSGTVGSGHLQGIGFYIDNDLLTRRSDTGEKGRGFIAPYVYIRLVLIDLASLAVQGEGTITASSARSSARNETGVDPWGAMTPQDKAAMLNSLIQQHVSAAVPLLFSAR